MIIEYGKKYICEDASVVGPLIASSDNYYIFECLETHRHFSMDGKCSLGDMPLMQPTTRYDIVKEYGEDCAAGTRASQHSHKDAASDEMKTPREIIRDYIEDCYTLHRESATIDANRVVQLLKDNNFEITKSPQQPVGNPDTMPVALTELEWACNITDSNGGEDVLVSYVRPRLAALRSLFTQPAPVKESLTTATIGEIEKAFRDGFSCGKECGEDAVDWPFILRPSPDEEQSWSKYLLEIHPSPQTNEVQP